MRELKLAPTRNSRSQIERPATSESLRKRLIFLITLLVAFDSTVLGQDNLPEEVRELARKVFLGAARVVDR